MKHLLAALFAVALISVGCGIPPNSEPQVVAEEIPNGLLPPAEQTTTTVGRLGANVQAAKIYLLLTEEQTLEVVDRTLQDGLSFLSLIQAVIDGPTVEEQERGLSSPIPATKDLIIGEPVLDQNRLTIDLGDAFWELGVTDRRIAAAQIVFTAAAATDVKEVEFLRNGERRAIPDSDGSIQDPRPLTIADFEELNPNNKADPDTQA